MRPVKALITAVGLLIATYGFAQNPIKRYYAAKKINNTQYQIHLTALIDEGWHLYSQNQPETAIALPITIIFSTNPMIRLKGGIREQCRLQKVKEEALEIEVRQYADKVSFIQLIEVKKQVKTNLIGTIEFQACTNE